jgi:hypothetical protein
MLSPPTSVGDDHPPGEWLARHLSSDLAGRGWVADTPDNWRDSGWSFRCSQATAELTVALAQLGEPSKWMLQVAPARGAGLMAVFGRKPSASPGQVLELAKAVHESLLTQGTVSGLGWRWDGEPAVGRSSPKPGPPE